MHQMIHCMAFSFPRIRILFPNQDTSSEDSILNRMSDSTTIHIPVHILACSPFLLLMCIGSRVSFSPQNYPLSNSDTEAGRLTALTLAQKITFFNKLAKIIFKNIVKKQTRSNNSKKSCWGELEMLCYVFRYIKDFSEHVQLC